MRESLRNTGNVLMLAGALNGVGFIANAGFGLIPEIEGKVVDPIRGTLCELKNTPVLDIPLQYIDCDLEEALKKPQLTQVFSTEGHREAMTLTRNLSVKNKRERSIDVARSEFQGDFVGKVYMPAATFYESENGHFVVRSETGDNINLGELEFIPLMPQTSESEEFGDLECNTPPESANYRGCVSTKMYSGFFHNIPGIGADNNNNIMRASLGMINAIAEDFSCTVNHVIVPGLSEALGRQITPAEAMEYVVRAHIRSIAWRNHGVAPQKIDIGIEGERQFRLPPELQVSYSALRKQYGFLPKADIKPSYCIESGESSVSVNGRTGLDDKGWAYVAAMGGPIVEDYYNPATGKSAPNARNLRRDG
jgi:hypothetical protein